MRVVFIGAYAYARQVLEALPEPPVAIYTSANHKAPRWQDLSDLYPAVPRYTDPARTLGWQSPGLVVVAGWRRIVPVLAPTVGFHSAKLPEYPGRAPVPNAILRGDKTLTNTMLWLTNGEPDDGDIIDEWTFPIEGRDPDDIYREIGETSALMLKRHWDGLFDGTAPRRKQNPKRRGPLTPADAWKKLKA